MLDSAKLGRFVDQVWGDAIVPTLVDYIRIPNKSPAFDPDWAAHGHMEEAVAMFERRARQGGEPHAADSDRGAGQRLESEHRHGAALWPSRQAAGDGRLGRGLRPM